MAYNFIFKFVHMHLIILESTKFSFSSTNIVYRTQVRGYHLNIYFPVRHKHFNVFAYVSEQAEQRATLLNV